MEDYITLQKVPYVPLLEPNIAYQVAVTIKFKVKQKQSANMKQEQ